MTMQNEPPESYWPILAELEKNGVVAPVVAGQAANIWANAYREWDTNHNPADPQLSAYVPYVSKDMEVLDIAGITDALKDNPAQTGVDEDKSPFGRTISPDRATILYNIAGKTLKIQVMRGINGLDRDTWEPYFVRLPIKWNTVRFEIDVLHPFNALRGKIANVVTLPQQDRQDVKHVNMLIRCVYADIGMSIQKNEPARVILKKVKHIAALASTKYAQKIKTQHGIEVGGAIPMKLLEESQDRTLKAYADSIKNPGPRIRF